MRPDGRIPILYLAPWVDFGGSDTSTVDWFRWLDRSRFAPSLICTQPSSNRRLNDIAPYAAEVWALPDIMPGNSFPGFILDFVHSRGIEIVHLMNSRLGFSMIPDLKTLPSPPQIVVQLHVEEPDRSGYVRFVATRFGNLVDGFSISSRQLYGVVLGYAVPPSKCRVIYTGIDATETFSPDRVRSPVVLEEGPTNILFCGRLCEQKDPLLLVNIASRLRDEGVDFRVHVIGDGPLEGDVRAAVRDRGLSAVVLFHGARTELAPWYAACDLMLMTSVFEGIPLVLYAAMAMRIPVVAPALPGIVELGGDTAGMLINPRDDVAAYVSALRELITNPNTRQLLGTGARERVLEEFSLERMGREHGEFYLELLAERQVSEEVEANSSAVEEIGPVQDPRPVLMRSRPLRERPLVSVVIPCFEQGPYLRECVQTVRDQSYPRIETIVVDDASRDVETLSVLDELAPQDEVIVIRLPRNLGPSGARQVGIDRAAGRYVFPVDADNRLLPSAIELLVNQLQESGEHVGFVYPNQSFFGLRSDYAEAPVFNLHSLLGWNFCDTSSLIDRDVFDAGIRFGDELRWTHEDWDFALSMAERGVQGVPARGRHLEVRKAGFTRGDLVDHADESRATMIRRHPSLYARHLQIKARWSPALTIIALEQITDLDEARRQLRDNLRAQTCADAELIIRDDRWWWRDPAGPNVRRVPAHHDVTLAAALATALTIAKGKLILVLAGDFVNLLSDHAAIEKVVRLHTSGAEPAGVAFIAGDGRPTFAPTGTTNGAREPVVGVLWPTTLVGDVMVALRGEDPLRNLVDSLQSCLPGDMSWRHMPLRAPDPRQSNEQRLGPPRGHIARLGGGRDPISEPQRKERVVRLQHDPLLPGHPVSAMAVATHRVDTWRPALTRVLSRHVDPSGYFYGLSHDTQTPPGCFPDYELGSISLVQGMGTVELVVAPGPRFRTVPAGELRHDEEGHLGYLELAGFALLDQIYIARHRWSGQQVLIAGEDDPLHADVEILQHIGFIEPYPLRPRSQPRASPHAAALRELAAAQRELAVLRPVATRYQLLVESPPGRLAKKALKIPGARPLARRAYELLRRK